MGGSPFISVVIDTYNYGHFICQAIDSVLDQKIYGIETEIIVVDDGSKDDTATRISVYGDKITYVQKNNGGQASAFNLGVAMARGEIVCFLDADDYFYPSKLHDITDEFLRDPKIGVVYNRYDVVDKDGNLLYKSMPPKIKSGNLEDQTLFGFVVGSPSSGISVKRELLSRIPVPEETFRISADHFYLSILPLMANIGFVMNSLHAYRVHDSNFYLSKSDASRLAINAKQTQVIWKYAYEKLGKQFYGAVHESTWSKSSGSLHEQLNAYRSEMRWIKNIQIPLWIKLWTLCKLTFFAVLPSGIYWRLQAFFRSVRTGTHY